MKDYHLHYLLDAQIQYVFLVDLKVELLKNSEIELMKRKDEIHMLKRECNTMHKAILMEQRIAPDSTSIYEELASLKEQVYYNFNTIKLFCTSYCAFKIST